MESEMDREIAKRRKQPTISERVEPIHRVEPTVYNNYTRNSCAQLGAPTGSVPNPNHHSIALLEPAAHGMGAPRGN